MSNMENDEVRAFEKEHAKLFPYHTVYIKNDSGEYIDLHCRLAFKLWNAALQQAKPKQGVGEVKCQHEPYHGVCVHCNVPFINGAPATTQPIPVEPKQAQVGAVEVCSDCDIAGCTHIRNRTGAFANKPTIASFSAKLEANQALLMVADDKVNKLNAIVMLMADKLEKHGEKFVEAEFDEALKQIGEV